jgi:hypothetical protein
MDKTRTPLTKWFAAMYLVAEDKRGLSAMALQKKIGVAYFTAFSKEYVKPGSEIKTDGLNIYNCLAKEGFTHTAIPFDAKKQPDRLHWTHIVISNAKAFVRGTFTDSPPNICNVIWMSSAIG